MIADATERFGRAACRDRLRFQVGDVERLPFDSESFDGIVCAGVLRYVPSLHRALAEIHRVLRPGGTVVVSFYYRFSPHWCAMCLVYRPLLPVISLLKGRSVQECVNKYEAEPLAFSYRSFARQFNRAGFGNLALRHAGFELFPFNRLFPRLSRRCYLTVEPVLADSDVLGWLGSICIVKGTRLPPERVTT
jgi:ubiquinone/menaquinone biosynthesis C-methylase UbiE